MDNSFDSENLMKILDESILNEEMSDESFEDSLENIWKNEYQNDINRLPKSLQPSGKRAVKCLANIRYFTKMLDVHKKRILKKALTLFEKDSQEYQKIEKTVKNWK